jgi:hypothetical protein
MFSKLMLAMTVRTTPIHRPLPTTDNTLGGIAVPALHLAKVSNFDESAPICEALLHNLGVSAGVARWRKQR